MLIEYERDICVIVILFTFLSGRGLCGETQPIPAALKKADLGIVETGDAPHTLPQPEEESPTDECSNYNLKIGISNIHYHTCCGGLRNTTVKEETQFVNFHCNPRRLGYAILNETSFFNCNGKTGQVNVKERCSERWGWVQEPLECWIWSECFAGACEQELVELGSTKHSDTTFCGDGRCDANIENSTNCAIDCCQIDNPDECVAKNNTCPKACCGDSYCCNGPKTATQLMVQKFWMILLGVLIALIVVINLICCCCCYCCYSKWCKKEGRRYSHIDIEMPKTQHRKK